FLRQYLPQTDFAFGYFPGREGFYLSAKAKDILLKHRVIQIQEIEPVMILDEAPNGCAQLDGHLPKLHFYYGHNRDIGSRSYDQIKILHEQAYIQYLQ